MDIKVLVTRNIDCSNLTLDEFVNFMSEDLESAVKAYDEYWLPIYEERHKKYMEGYRKSVLRVSTQYAENKWKTEKKRKEYIDKKMSEIEDKSFFYPHLTFFDIDLNPGDNGISDDCILKCNEINKNTIGRCFNKIKDNKYFLKATGWILEDHHGFRPQIRLILPDEVQNEFDKERKDLEDAICRFYSGTTYFGD